MALRTETFYYSHRKGGPQVLPVDIPAFVRSLLPRPADDGSASTSPASRADGADGAPTLLGRKDLQARGRGDRVETAAAAIDNHGPRTAKTESRRSVSPSATPPPGARATRRLRSRR